MNHLKLIDELLHELSYRVGIVDIYNKEQQSLMSEILTEWGEWESKEKIFNFLNEEDEKRFNNPILNKKITYKTKDGKEEEGLVGNLITSPKDSPGRIEAEKLLPAEGTPEREELNKEIGSQSGGGPQDGQQGGGTDGVQQEKPQGTALSGKGGEDYKSKLPEDDPASTKKDKDTTPKGNGYVGSKNKTLKDIQPTESEEYNRDLEPNDDTFNERNKNNANPTPPEPISLDGIVSNPKFPKRYIKVLERMINSRYTNETKKWEHFSDISGGAGLSPAQAGELMAMMGSTMSDDVWNTFKTKILEHETELKNNHKDVFMKKNKTGGYVDNTGSRIINSTWVRAANNNRNAILTRLKKQYGEGTEVSASAWDTKNEAEALGMDNYAENKGFSTDMYLRVKKPNGEEVLDEVSLKKSKDVNFLNSGAGQFKEWLGDDLPDNLNQNVYKDRQRDDLVKSGNSLKEDIKKLLESNSSEAKDLKQFYKRKGIDFEQALIDMENGKGSRDKSNVVLKSIQSLANWPTWGKSGDRGPKSDGNPISIEHLRKVSEQQTKFVEDSIEAIAKNSKMTEGMLQTIREEFPLKAVSEGEETMAIGDMSLDKDTMQEIFGTSNYDEIKEKLVSEPGPPPFLGYRAEVGSDAIPIAEISIREDGVGYGGQMKFEMKLDKRFAAILSDATSKVYSK